MSRIICMNDSRKPIHLQKKAVVETQAGAGLSGRFDAEAFRCQDRIDLDAAGMVTSTEIPGSRRPACSMDNMILDNALEYYGSGNSQYGRCHVGLSSQAESTSDTRLIIWTASAGFSTAPAENYSFASGSAPYWGARRKRARFSPNFGGGDVNLNELGVSPLSETDQTNGYLTARALTRDSNGDPFRADPTWLDHHCISPAS